MDVTDITPQLEKVDENLDQLEDALKPLLGDIGVLSSKLPLLDKAKLYVLACYALESLLFSSLRLNGVETKNHAIFTELTRVRQYFDKIQKVESPPPPRETTLNTEAAIRFVRNDLGDNKDLVGKLTEQIAKERAKIAAAEKKRPATDEASAAQEAGGGRSGETRENLAKRPKHGGSKKKK